MIVLSVGDGQIAFLGASARAKFAGSARCVTIFRLGFYRFLGLMMKFFRDLKCIVMHKGEYDEEYVWEEVKPGSAIRHRVTVKKGCPYCGREMK